MCTCLPITPFHYPVAKILHRLDPKVSLSLPALIVGSMVPDLEVPVMCFLTGFAQDRLVLHSFLGGLTLGLLVAVALTVLLYPLLSRVFPISRDRLKEKCRFSTVVVFSCFLGVLSHVLLDMLTHLYNPLFWPFLSLYETPNPIVVFLGGEDIASLATHGLMVLLFVGLFFKDRDGFWEKLLVG